MCHVSIVYHANDGKYKNKSIAQIKCTGRLLFRRNLCLKFIFDAFTLFRFPFIKYKGCNSKIYNNSFHCGVAGAD
jgi:hypothetical protein